MTYKDLLNDPQTRSAYITEEIGVPEDELPNTLIVTPIPFDMVFPEGYLHRLKMAGCETYEKPSGDYVLQKLSTNLLIRCNNREVLLAILGRGTVEFSDRIYMLAATGRVKQVIFLGSAASLQDHVVSGDINVPELALPIENVSALHVDVNRAVPRADKKLHRKLLALSREFTPTQIHSERHATVTLFYQETRELLEFLRDFGVATIDMEISALYRIANYYDVAAAAMVRVGDMPLHGKHILDEESRRHREEAKKVAKEALFRTAIAATLGEKVAKRL